MDRPGSRPLSFGRLRPTWVGAVFALNWVNLYPAAGDAGNTAGSGADVFYSPQPRSEAVREAMHAITLDGIALENASISECLEIFQAKCAKPEGVKFPGYVIMPGVDGEEC